MEITSRQVCDDLMNLVGHVKSTMFQIAEAHGLTPVQLVALHAIMNGGATMGRVADMMHCDASNVTGVVDRLVAQKLVVRAESESDRRAKTLALTPEATHMMNAILKSLPERLGCTKFTNKERAVLHDAFSKLMQTV